MNDYNLTLEERAVFERLVRDNANACIDLMKARDTVLAAEGRVSATQHAINDYVNQRTKRIVFVERVNPLKVPTGTQDEPPKPPTARHYPSETTFADPPPMGQYSGN